MQQVLRVSNALPTIDTATVIDRVMHHIPTPSAPEPEPGVGPDQRDLPTPPTLHTRHPRPEPHDSACPDPAGGGTARLTLPDVDRGAVRPRRRP